MASRVLENKVRYLRAQLAAKGEKPVPSTGAEMQLNTAIGQYLRSRKPTRSVAKAITTREDSHGLISAASQSAKLGRKGGKARFQTMIKEERRESARKAVQARWAEKRSDS